MPKKNCGPKYFFLANKLRPTFIFWTKCIFANFFLFQNIYFFWQKMFFYRRKKQTKNKIIEMKKKKVSSQANIGRDSTRSLHDLRKRGFCNVADRKTDTQTHRHTDTQTDMATSRLNRPKGRFSEKLVNLEHMTFRDVCSMYVVKGTNQ